MIFIHPRFFSKSTYAEWIRHMSSLPSQFEAFITDFIRKLKNEVDRREHGGIQAVADELGISRDTLENWLNPTKQKRKGHCASRSDTIYRFQVE